MAKRNEADGSGRNGGRGPTPRSAAVRMIAAATGEGRLMSESLGTGVLDGLDPAARARAQRLATETFRQMPRADKVLKPFLRKVPPAAVLAVLRLATVEMLALGAAPHGVVGEAVEMLRQGGRRTETYAGLANAVLAVLRLATVEMLALGAAPHGVVGEAVEMLRQGGRRTETYAGLANAVLRKVAGLGMTPAQWAALPVPELPSWLRGRLMSAWGKQATQAMEVAHLAGAALDLTPKDGDAAGLAARLGGVALATGSVRLADPGQVSGLAGFAEGDWWVQDAAAAIPARLLAARPGERVADLCAAPGGKTMQMAAAGAEVIALDVSEARLARLEENLARTGLKATVVAGDATAWRPEAFLDAVLLDAPCSATGTLRRHPDLPHAKTAEGLRPLFDYQAEMLDHALTLIRPGGRLVFCTCSLLPEEGELQLAKLLDRHPQLTPDTAALAQDWIAPEWRAGPAALRLRPDFWPDLGGMDGFFIACLRLPG